MVDGSLLAYAGKAGMRTADRRYGLLNVLGESLNAASKARARRRCLY